MQFTGNSCIRPSLTAATERRAAAQFESEGEIVCHVGRLFRTRMTSSAQRLITAEVFGTSGFG